MLFDPPPYTVGVTTNIGSSDGKFTTFDFESHATKSRPIIRVKNIIREKFRVVYLLN